MMRLTDGDDREYTASKVQFAGSLQSGELAKGEKVRGELAFLTKSSSGIRIEYTPAGTKKPIAIQLTK